MSVVHLSPQSGQAKFPCCGRLPFECIADRMTVNPELVTCGGEVKPYCSVCGVPLSRSVIDAVFESLSAEEMFSTDHEVFVEVQRHAIMLLPTPIVVGTTTMTHGCQHPECEWLATQHHTTSYVMHIARVTVQALYAHRVKVDTGR